MIRYGWVISFAFATLAGCNREAAEERALIAEAQAAISADLIDPSSAEFSDVKTDGAAVCGSVNAKNRLGGYVGRKRFVYVRGGTAQMESDSVGALDRCMFDALYGDCMGEVAAPSLLTCAAPEAGN